MHLVYNRRAANLFRPRPSSSEDRAENASSSVSFPAECRQHDEKPPTDDVDDFMLP